jgi:hypothetical protein
MLANHDNAAALIKGGVIATYESGIDPFCLQ